MLNATAAGCGNDYLHRLLAAVAPFQSFFDHPATTHEFCNRQGLQILRNDGFGHYADFLQDYTKELNMGVNWADKGWKNVHHYFDPVTKKGLWQFAAAPSIFNMYYQQALQFARRCHFRRAVFFLGAAAHLVQDVCVPHHARAKLFDGHKQYEVWAQENFTGYAVINGGAYSEKRLPTNLLVANARIAADFFDQVRHEGDTVNYRKVTTEVLALAQRSTASLLQSFVEEAAMTSRCSPGNSLRKLSVA
jgi:phospholipase C